MGPEWHLPFCSHIVALHFVQWTCVANIFFFFLAACSCRLSASFQNVSRAWTHKHVDRHHLFLNLSVLLTHFKEVFSPDLTDSQPCTQEPEGELVPRGLSEQTLLRLQEGCPGSTARSDSH